MKVPKGKTLYIGNKKLKAGMEIPALLEKKAEAIFSKKNKTFEPKSVKKDVSK